MIFAINLKFPTRPKNLGQTLKYVKDKKSFSGEIRIRTTNMGLEI